MSTLRILTSPLAEERHARRIVNDCSIQIATVNGSGSQTANNVLMRSIYQMGIPVSGKNLFPSNIAGLPTWFTIRANKRGYIGRKRETDILVAMNPESAQEDVAALSPGAAVVCDTQLRLDGLRGDLHYYPVPFDELVKPVCPDAKIRKMVRNMIYVGVLAHVLGIDLDAVRAALVKQFGPRKAKAADLNWAAVLAGRDFAEENLEKADPYSLEPMESTRGKFIIDGNAAAAIGCMFAGVTVATWYPITPSSSMIEALIHYMKRYRHDPETGSPTYAIVQAEDELAAVGMVIGAGWAGARSMTATSGPGISLMSELVGLGYFAEIPAVIFDIQRAGPSTGLPTRTMQGDILKNALLSHGDARHPILFPSSPEECFSMAIEAFDIAEMFQTPVFVNSDLDLGMNNWISSPFDYPQTPPRRGKVLGAQELEQLGEFARYRDMDGDGVGCRTLPGTRHPMAAYFTRGSGHNDKAQYSERPEDYVRNMDRLQRKLESIRAALPKPEAHLNPKARIGILYCGTTRYSAEESRDQLSEDHGVETSGLRVKSYPFADEVYRFLELHDRIYVVEQNRDGQLSGLIRLDGAAAQIAKLRSIRYYGGLPLDARTVTDELLRQECL